jgi:hypothetical protein
MQLYNELLTIVVGLENFVLGPWYLEYSPNMVKDSGNLKVVLYHGVSEVGILQT